MTSPPAKTLIVLLFRTHCIDKKCYFGAVSQTVLLWHQFLEKTLTLNSDWDTFRQRDTYGAFPLHGTARYGTVHFWGVFHWVLYLVPDTFLVPLRSRFHASRTVTKTWRVNSADHWLAGENRHYCVTELAARDPPLQSYPLDLNQHSQRRIGRNFCLNKRTFLHQPQNSSVVVCWGSTDVPLVDSRGADPARAWWRDAEGKSLMYITLLLNLLYFQSMFSVYIFTSVSVFCFN